MIEIRREDLPPELQKVLDKIVEGIQSDPKKAHEAAAGQVKLVSAVLSGVSDGLETHASMREVDPHLQMLATELYNSCAHYCSVYMALEHLNEPN